MLNTSFVEKKKNVKLTKNSKKMLLTKKLYFIFQAEENNPIPSYYRIVTFYMYAMVEKDDCLSGFITFELIEELHEAVYYYINRCLDGMCLFLVYVLL